MIELVFSTSYTKFPSSGLVRYKDKLRKFFMFKLSNPTIYQIVNEDNKIIYAFTEKELNVGSRSYNYTV